MERYSCKVKIPSCYEKSSHIHSTILGFAKAANYGDHEFFVIGLSLEEAVSNAIKHGNRFDQTKFVTVECDITQAELFLVVEDEGAGFDPNSVPDPTLPEFITEPNGRGLLLMRELMTEMDYNDRGNRLTMRLICQRASQG